MSISFSRVPESKIVVSVSYIFVAGAMKSYTK
jgi:hypothetical protein